LRNYSTTRYPNMNCNHYMHACTNTWSKVNAGGEGIMEKCFFFQSKHSPPPLLCFEICWFHIFLSYSSASLMIWSDFFSGFLAFFLYKMDVRCLSTWTLCKMCNNSFSLDAPVADNKQEKYNLILDTEKASR